MGARIGAWLSGLLFGVGLVLSGMTQPAKVLGFLDVAGQWDASLAFVMCGAIAVYSPLYHLLLARSAASSAVATLPERIDGRLLVGAGVFGIGWGMGGFCPGPAITVLASGATPALVFGASMLAGMLLFSVLMPGVAQPPASGRNSLPTPLAD